MQRLLLFLLGTACGVALTLSASQADLDPVKVSPQLYRVRLENERVRVLEYHLAPGAKESMHSHVSGVVYVMSGATLRATSPEGKTTESEAASGEVIWRDPTTHALENIGKTEAAAMVVEVKACR